MKTTKTRESTDSEMPSIEELFDAYCRLTQVDNLGPLAEQDQRHAFFCGFESCMKVMEKLADIFEADEAKGQRIIDRLSAEFEKFAQASDSGESKVIH